MGETFLHTFFGDFPQSVVQIKLTPRGLSELNGADTSKWLI